MTDIPKSIFLLKSDLAMLHKRGPNVGGLVQPCVGDDCEEYTLAPSHADHIKAAVAGMPDLVWVLQEARPEYWANTGLSIVKIYDFNRFENRQLTDFEFGGRKYPTLDLAKAAANLHHREQLAKTLKGEERNG